MPSLIQTIGAQAGKPTRFAPLFINRAFTGIYTQRNPLRDPSDSVREKFYGGRPDALLAGANLELTNRLTLARRPGLSQFSAATYPEAPDYFYSFQKADGSIDVIVDTSAHVYLDNQDGTKTLILTKSAGAGQSQFQGIGSSLYIGDGVDLQKWNDFGNGVPGNNNGNTTNPSWNWGVVAPITAPTLLVTESGSSAVTWVTGTVYTTMGFLVDSNGNVQQLNSVNASGVNATQYGKTGNGNPAFSHTVGGSTADGSVTWTNFGPVGIWMASFLYENASSGGTLTNPCIIYDPASNSCYINIAPGGASGTTGTVRPHFTGTFASIFHDGSVKWECLGSPKQGATWQPTTSYPALGTVTNNDAVSSIMEPVGLPAPSNVTVFWQTSGGGTSSGSGAAPKWGTVAGQLTNPDGDLIWVCLGTATWHSLTAVSAWGGPGQLLFTAIKDSNGNMQVCVVSGTTASSAPTWETAYGATTNDGSAKWVCVGTSLSWAPTTQWYLPVAGFAPPTSSQPYGGASIEDSNSNVQFVINSGKSGATAPAWNGVGSPTTDNTVTWFCTGKYNNNFFSWSKGHTWAFSFASRLASDQYNTTPPPGLMNPLGPPTGSGSGGISSASPVAVITGQNSGAVVTVSGLGSTDPQVDTIIIWRDADGGGAANMFFLTEIPNPPPVGGVAQPWSFNDYIPDLPTSTLPGLNNLISAPIDDSNDPPLAGFKPDDYHFGRIWGHIGNTIYFSGGPDTLSGNGNESFPPANSFTFPGAITRAVAVPTGLIVFTVDSTYVIAGGPQLASFYSQPLIPGTGLLSFNALDMLGSIIYLFSSDRQFLSIDPSAGESEVGFPIGDQLATFNPLNAYVTAHISGSSDKAVYVADGSTGWYRMNPNQAPEGGAVWSPFAAITGGAKAVRSIETTPGVHELLVGATGGGDTIAKRDLTVFADEGTAYQSDFTMGTIVLAQPGQMAELEFITLDLPRIGTAPTVSYLLDETSGTFTVFNSSPISEPPELYGNTTHPATLFSNRYYFNATPQGGGNPPPAWCRFLQIKIDYGNADTVQNELYTLTIFGTVYQEK
jgi:hypothetical protein